MSRRILKDGEDRIEIYLSAADARKFSKLCSWWHVKKAPALRKAILGAYDLERVRREVRREQLRIEAKLGTEGNHG